MRTSLLLSLLALMATAPAALIACSHQEEASGADESHLTAGEDKKEEGSNPKDGSQGAEEGSACWQSQDCAEGLVCKKRPHGPPPGAVGMPVPAGSSSSGGHMPPGAVGMPLPSNTCQVPAPGEEGSTCLATAECNDGLVCSFDDAKGSSSGGMPPGAVGMPVPSHSSTSSSGHAMPPGAVGMPILQHGKCAKDEGSGSSSSSGGMPPGAVGMPIHP